jgi:hypothetical protein
MGLGSWPGGPPRKDGASAPSGAGSVDTATTYPSETSRTKNLSIEFKDEHGHELFRRRGGESPQEMEEAGYLEVPMGTFADEIWMAEEHAGCGGRQVYAVTSA